MAAFFFVLHRAGWKFGQQFSPHDPVYMQATTACLSAIIVMQVVNVFLCRSTTRSIAATGILGNKLILAGVVLELALLLFIIYPPWGNSLLGAAPVAGAVWLFVMPFAASMLVLEELRKRIARGSTAASLSRNNFRQD
jgi:magnesium-transporting ATPase (P-type)